MLSAFHAVFVSTILVLVLLVLPLFSYTRAHNAHTSTGTGAGISIRAREGFRTLLTPATASAAASDNLNFQARLQTAGGAIVPDGYYNIEFKLYTAVSSSGSSQGSCAGDAACVWSETRYDSNGVTAGNDNRVRVVNGYVSVYLGSITSFPGTIPWDQQLYLTMNVGGSTQTATPTYDGEMSPRLKLTAVPYAMQAKQASQLSTSNGALQSILSITAPTVGSQTFVIQNQGAAGTYNLLTAPSGSDGYVKLQAASPGTQQTGNINISGSILSPTLDTASGVALNIGTTNATTVNVATNAIAHAINIGNGAAAQTITIGSTNTSSTTTIVGGGSSLAVANAGLTIVGNTTTSGTISTTSGSAAGVGTQLLASNLYIQSRGENLVTNGTGLLGNNYNFTSFTFDPQNVFAGGGSFKNSTFNAVVLSDELIPVDPSSTYQMTLAAEATTYVAGAHAYFGVSTYDIDGNAIGTQMYSKYTGSTDTTLAAPLNPGDTTVTLTDATGWQNAGSGFQRDFAWYGYTNAKGYTYPDYTYTRNGAFNYVADYSTNGVWAAGGISGNVITLRSAWTGPALPSGAAIRNNALGGTYKYITDAVNTVIPSTWTTYSGRIGGYDTTGAMATNLFPYGTAYVKLLFLMNRDVAGNTTNVSNVTFTNNSGVFNAQNTITTPVIIKGATSQTADLLQVQNSVGTILSKFDSSGNLVVSAAGASSFAGTVGITGLLTASGGVTVAANKTLTNNGASIFVPLATIPDDVNGGTIGASAAATVDIASSLSLNQTTTSQTMTLFSPTLATAGRVIYINNIGSATFTLYGVSIGAAKSQGYIWNGTAWTPLGVDGSGSGATSVNPISATSNANGGTISGGILTLTAADGTNGGVVTNTTQTFAGAKTFAALLTGQAGLAITGAAISLNNNSNFATSINTGSSTGTISIGNGSAGAVTIQSGTSIALTGNTTIGITAGNTVGLGNSTGAVTFTGSNGSTFVINGVTVDATEFNRLDGKDAALVDTNDAVATAITGVGTLTGLTVSGATSLTGATTINTTGTGTTTIGNTTNGGAVSINSNAASNFTTSAGALTLQGFAGVSILTPAGTTSSDITIATGNASGGASGNVSIDTGTASTTTGTISIGTGNASGITMSKSGAVTTFQGSILANESVNIGGTYTTGAAGINYRMSINGSLNSAVIGSQYGLNNAVNFNPTGLSLSAVYGLVNTAKINSSALDISQVMGSVTGISTGATYTGIIDNGYGLNVSAVALAGTKKINNYFGIAVGSATANTGTTTGTYNNTGIRILASTPAAAGGIMNNYGIRMDTPGGSGAGTTNNYGLYIQGDGGTGGAGTTVNYAIYDSSAADVYLQGNTSIGTSTNASGYKLNVVGTTGLTGNAFINTTGTGTTSIGNSTGTVTFTGSNGSTFVINGVTVDATEFNRLDGKDAALIDTNDAVATAITSTGTLTSLTVSGAAALNGNNTIGDALTDTITFGGTIQGTNALVFEGSTADANETTISITNPTAPHSIAIPDAGGTFAVSASGNIALSALGNITFSGTLPIANGGTNNNGTIGGAGSIVYSDGTKYAYSATTASSGQCLLSGASGTGQPTWASCPANGANAALSNLVGVNIGATALNSTSSNLNLTTTTSGNIVLNSAGTIELQDSTNITGVLSVTSTITGTTLNGTTGINTGASTGTQRIDASGNLVNIGLITGQGVVGVNDSVVLNRTFEQGMGTTYYYKLATLPITTSGTYDHLHLNATVNTGWAASQNTYIDATFGNRNAFSYQYTLKGASVNANSKLAAYQNADGSTDIYIILNGAAFTSASYSVIENLSATIYANPNGSRTSTAPSGGAYVFDSSDTATYVPATRIDISGNMTIQGIMQGTRLISTVATGTAPLQVASTTVVTNLNSDLLDGQTGSYYQNASNINAGTIADAYLSSNVVLLNNAQTITGAKTFSATSSFTGSVLLNNSNNFSLVANATTPTDVGDIIFQSNASVEYGRIYSNPGLLALSGSANTSAELTLAEGIVTANGLLNVTGDIQGNGKTVARTTDAWLRINPDNDFTGGTYYASGIVRTDGTLQVGASGATLNVISGGALSINSTYFDLSTATMSIGPSATNNTVITANGGNHSIEMGKTDGTASTPFIDFHSSANTGVDYDTRIISSGGSAAAGDGTLTIEAAQTTINSTVAMVSSNATGSIVRMTNTSNAVGADVLRLDLNLTCTGLTGGNNFVTFFSTPDGVAGGAIDGYPSPTNCSSGTVVRYATNGADYGEYFRVADGAVKPDAYELVAFKDSTDSEVVKADSTTSTLVGAVSVTTGFLGNGPSCKEAELKTCKQQYIDDNVIVALAGQVKVKVSAEHGAIAVGDPIGVSSVGGVGAKQIGAGHIAGYAMNSLVSGTGEIQVLIRPQYFVPKTIDILQDSSLSVSQNMTINADLSITGNTSTTDLNVTGNAQFATVTIAQNLTVQGDVLIAGALRIADIYVGGHIVSTGIAPQIAVGSALGIGQGGTNDPTAVVDGTDNAGTVHVVAGVQNVVSGSLAHVTFNKAFTGTYKVVVSAGNDNAAFLRVYTTKTATGFDIVARDSAQVGTDYQFDYIVIGVQ